MDALSKPFGTLHGVPVVGYYLENARGTRVCVLNLGGIVQDYSLRTDNGRLPLVISYDNAADYVQNPFQINKQIGRVAGRIAGAAFDLFGKSCRVEANEGRNALHGGSHGLAGRLFTVQRLDAQLLRLSTTVTAAQDGYPGDLELRIDYQLDADDRLATKRQRTATLCLTRPCISTGACRAACTAAPYTSRRANISPLMRKNCRSMQTTTPLTTSATRVRWMMPCAQAGGLTTSTASPLTSTRQQPS